MFEKIYEKLGIPYGRREINRTFEKHYRRDNAYESLSKIWIRHPEIRPVLLRAVETVFSNGTEMAAITPQDLAFRAYVSALSKNWDDACRQMYEIISVEKGENVDSWIDLGHFLRKIEGFEHASLCILLNPE